jgi:prepilin-type N-terminal cleavage/methylation domain-containing protein
MARTKIKAFSLVELVIVIVIIGIIAAIAVPRISRGAKGASDAALRANLARMRNAIDLFNAEHNGIYPAVTNDLEALTAKTNISGAVGTTAGEHIYGPYLKAIPPLPVKGEGTVGGAPGDTGVAAADGAGVGWLYDASIGEISANTGTATDDAGDNYSDY